MRRGLILMVVSGVIWLFIKNALSLSGILKAERLRSATGAMLEQPDDYLSILQSSMPNYFNVWLFSMLGELSVAGFFSGWVMVFLGYVKLFLAKQAVFEQHINEQLNIRAGGNVDATQLGKGAKYMGDRTNVGGDIVGSAVGRDSSLNARDISVFKQTVDRSMTLDAELKEKLALAREEIEKLDVPIEEKKDVTDDLKKLTEELDKPNPTPSRVDRFFKRIEEVAPTVSTILASATKIVQLLGIAT